MIVCIWTKWRKIIPLDNHILIFINPTPAYSHRIGSPTSIAADGPAGNSAKLISIPSFRKTINWWVLQVNIFHILYVSSTEHTSSSSSSSTSSRAKCVYYKFIIYVSRIRSGKQWILIFHDIIFLILCTFLKYADVRSWIIIHFFSWLFTYILLSVGAITGESERVWPELA